MQWPACAAVPYTSIVRQRLRYTQPLVLSSVFVSLFFAFVCERPRDHGARPAGLPGDAGKSPVARIGWEETGHGSGGSDKSGIGIDCDVVLMCMRSDAAATPAGAGIGGSE